MRAAGGAAVELVLPTASRERGEPGADATAGRAVHADTVLRQPADDGLAAEHGHAVNRKRVRRLLRLMGLEAIYPKPRLSQPGARGHRSYPYLLRALPITRADQVWSTDITYVPLRQGFMYLVAILDWYSRYVLSLGAVEHARQAVLPGRAGDGAGPGAARRSSTRTRARSSPARRSLADSKRRTCGSVGMGAGAPRQRLRRAALALGQVRGGVPQDYDTVAEAVGGLGRYFRFYNESGLTRRSRTARRPRCMGAPSSVRTRSFLSSGDMGDAERDAAGWEDGTRRGGPRRTRGS